MQAAQCPPAILRACAAGRDGLRAVAVSNRRKVALATAVLEAQRQPRFLRRLSCRRARRRSVPLRAQPDTGAVSPAAILRRRHRREGDAPLSARYPAGVGAATEFAGCFVTMIIQTVVVERVIVRWVRIRVGRGRVAMVILADGLRNRLARRSYPTLRAVRYRYAGVVVGVRSRFRHAVSVFGTQYSFRRSPTSFPTRSVPFRTSF